MNITVSDLAAIVEIRRVLPQLPDDMPVAPDYAARILTALGRPYAVLTLRKFRCISSDGPRYQKAPNGRISYLVGDLKEFASRRFASAA